MISHGKTGVPALRVAVLEHAGRPPAGHLRCQIDRHLRFDPSGLASYFFSDWQPLVYDAFLVAAAIEFCDRTLRRPASWRRTFEVRIPVHDALHWRTTAVDKSLTDAVEFLTGDKWQFVFVTRTKPKDPPAQQPIALRFPSPCAVLPFSDGLDSRAVAGLLAQEWRERLILVRLGKKKIDRPKTAEGRAHPFSTMPYQVRADNLRFTESTLRSRGFKFTLLSGVAAYLAGAETVFLPESGQGALGPVLVPAGQSYEDYRNHPTFTRLMTTFLDALFGYRILFKFPRLWSTKGETLRAYMDAVPQADWSGTISCWHDTRSVSVNSRKRQCGVCAACLLRRMSIHSAKLDEAPTTYVWERLDTPTFAAGAAPGFMTAMRAHREYGVAGALHLDHLAQLADSRLHTDSVAAEARALGRAIDEDAGITRSKLIRLLNAHKLEWNSFVQNQGSQSFLAKWIA
jgi:hypothetical protein